MSTGTADDWKPVLLYSDFLEIDADYVIGEARRRAMNSTQLAARFQDSLTADPDSAFEEFQSVPPGLIDVRVFDQSTWWIDVLRTPHRIDDRHDFRDDHLINVVLYLRDNASWLRPLLLRRADRSDGMLCSEEWLARTPLMRTLLAEIETRNLNQ